MVDVYSTVKCYCLNDYSQFIWVQKVEKMIEMFTIHKKTGKVLFTMMSAHIMWLNMFYTIFVRIRELL